MIHIETKGGIKRDRTLAEKVIKFCIKKLLPRHRNLDITCTWSGFFKQSGNTHLGFKLARPRGKLSMRIGIHLCSRNVILIESYLSMSGVYSL